MIFLYREIQQNHFQTLMFIAAETCFVGMQVINNLINRVCFIKFSKYNYIIYCVNSGRYSPCNKYTLPTILLCQTFVLIRVCLIWSDTTHVCASLS